MHFYGVRRGIDLDIFHGARKETGIGGSFKKVRALFWERAKFGIIFAHRTATNSGCLPPCPSK
jgi:hypothetical protein